MKTINKYSAYDWEDFDINGEPYSKEIDIAGEEYQMLIEKCFKYSSCFSLVFRPDNKDIPYPIELRYEKQKDYPEYNNYIIKSVISNEWPGTSTELTGELRYYRCCKETKEMLYKFSDSIFAFEFVFGEHFNPEDPCFYRSDGTVLFASQIHEGECYLFPREDEDFEDVLKAIPWFKEEYPIERYERWYNDLAVGMSKEDFLK